MKPFVFILILILPTICLLGMERDEGSDKERRSVSCLPEQPQRKKVHLNPAEQAEVDNQLVNAAALGSIQLAEEAFQKGADINARTKAGDQLIHIAANNGHLEMAEWLIANGADINSLDQSGWQPIHWAAKSGRLNLLKLLVEKGADINARTEGGNQLIHIAAYNGHLETAEWLIGNRADINSLNQSGWQPIHCAAQSGKPNVVKLLVDKGADINARSKDGDQLIHIAAYSGCCEMIEWLIANGADINARTEEGNQLIHIAATNGHCEIVEWLIVNGADINCLGKYDWQPIHCAAESGELNVLKLLVEKGADINARTKGGNQPIRFAADNRQLEMVEWLIAHGDSSEGLLPEILSKFSTQSLVHTVLTRNTQKIKDFLRDKFDEQDFNKTFPLMIALGQHLIEEFSDDMLAKVTEETWKLALEAATAHTNTDTFNWVYQLVRERLPEDKVLIAVESALLWATINVNERVVGLILEHAFCDAHVSNLSLSAARRRLNYVLIHNGPFTSAFLLSTKEQRASLIRIRRMLVDAAQAINKTGLLAHALQPHDPAAPSLAQLPPEVLTNIARYLFRST